MKKIPLQTFTKNTEYSSPYIVAITSSLTNPGEIHVCSLDAEFGEKICNCWGVHQGFCSHLVAVIMALDEPEREGLIKEYVNSVSKGVELQAEIIKKLGITPTSLEAVNTQIGGFAPRTLTNICGQPGAGKTILLTQLSWEYLKLNPDKNVLYVGTEGGEEYAVEGWGLKSFYERYLEPDIIKIDSSNINLKQKLGKKQAIFLYYETNILEILKNHGFPLNFKVSKDGKINVRLNLPSIKKGKASSFAEFPRLKDSPIGKFIEDHNIGMVVYDSVSMPNRVFISGQVNFPARGNAQELWFAQMQDAAKTDNLVVMASTHITKDDTNKFDMGKPLGGDIVAYNFKVVLRVSRYLNPRSKLPAQNPMLINKRKLTRERFFFEKCGTQAGITCLDLTDEGYKDVIEVPVEEKAEEGDVETAGEDESGKEEN
jgi:RecA/RadA recombinase